jgi:hypothetical protein
MPEIRVPVAERRAFKQAWEKIRVQEEAVRLKRRLLQRREEQVKVQANRIAELENIIGLRTCSTYVDERALHAASTVRFLEGRRYRYVSFHVDENDVASTPSNRTKPRSRALSAKHDPCQLGRPRRIRPSANDGIQRLVEISECLLRWPAQLFDIGGNAPDGYRNGMASTR